MFNINDKGNDFESDYTFLRQYSVVRGEKYYLEVLDINSKQRYGSDSALMSAGIVLPCLYLRFKLSRIQITNR